VGRGQAGDAPLSQKRTTIHASTGNAEVNFSYARNLFMNFPPVVLGKYQGNLWKVWTVSVSIGYIRPKFQSTNFRNCFRTTGKEFVGQKLFRASVGANWAPQIDLLKRTGSNSPYCLCLYSLSLCLPSSMQLGGCVNLLQFPTGLSEHIPFTEHSVIIITHDC
jgi:hypothetical protein